VDLLLVIAAVVLIGIGIAHSYLGEKYILIRLFRRDDLPHLFGSDWFTKRTLRFAWHLTSVAWMAWAAVLLILADESAGDPLESVGLVIAITFAIHAIVTAAVSRGRHLAWIGFALVAVLTFVWL
jgi:hypothetical protein